MNQNRNRQSERLAGFFVAIVNRRVTPRIFCFGPMSPWVGSEDYWKKCSTPLGLTRNHIQIGFPVLFSGSLPDFLY